MNEEKAENRGAADGPLSASVWKLGLPPPQRAAPVPRHPLGMGAGWGREEGGGWKEQVSRKGKESDGKLFKSAEKMLLSGCFRFALLFNDYIIIC